MDRIVLSLRFWHLEFKRKPFKRVRGVKKLTFDFMVLSTYFFSKKIFKNYFFLILKMNGMAVSTEGISREGKSPPKEHPTTTTTNQQTRGSTTTTATTRGSSPSKEVRGASPNKEVESFAVFFPRLLGSSIEIGGRGVFVFKNLFH